MADDYYQLPCETIGRSDPWHHVSDRPNMLGHAVWGFFPDVGNEDEGWGWIGVVYCDWDPLQYKYRWVDRYGYDLRPQPLMWAWINQPIVPIVYETEEMARENALNQIRRLPVPEQ